MNDVLVKNKNVEQHIQDLKETFEILRKYNMKLNPLKYTFGANSKKFLEFLITSEGLKMNLKKVKTILDMTPPKNNFFLQMLTGKITGLNRFISKLGERCSAFFKILRSVKRFEWGIECEEAFNKFKQLLSSPQIL